MRDEAIITEPQLSVAEGAICYLLQRVRVDADLRWHLVGTEAFHRLCAAEAKRRGEDLEIVKERYSTLLPRCRSDKPRLVMARERLAEISATCADSADSAASRIERICEIADRGLA